MNYRLHGFLFVLIMFAILIGGIFVAATASGWLANHAPVWLIPLPLLAWISTLFLTPRFITTIIPCRCPKCGGRVTFKKVASKFTDSLIPRSVYAYCCESCVWSSKRKWH